MKKTYINPEMEVVKLETQQIIASSPEVGGEYGGGVPQSRFFDLEDE